MSNQIKLCVDNLNTEIDNVYGEIGDDSEKIAIFEDSFNINNIKEYDSLVEKLASKNISPFYSFLLRLCAIRVQRYLK